MTSASRSTRGVPSTLGAQVPTTSRAPTTVPLKIRPTHGLRRVAWILEKTPGTMSSLAMP